MNEKEIENPSVEAGQPDDGLTRRELLKVGAGSMMGVALTGFPSPPEPRGDPELPEEDRARWFNTAAGMGRVRDGNSAEAFIDGRQAISDMMTAMRTANAQGHFIYLLGWWLTDSVQLIPAPRPVDSQILPLLTAAARAGVEVRVMLWDQLLAQNDAEKDHINAITLANGMPSSAAAIVDNRTLNIGSHHQKVLIVNGTKGLMAFCGGIDINPDRTYARGVAPNQAGDTDGAPLHDVQGMVQGPAAGDLLRIFVERWRDHPDVAKLRPAQRPLLGYNNNANTLVDIPLARAGATCHVQVGRTYGNGSARRGIDNTGAPFFRPVGYAFAPTGTQQCAQMFIQAIGAARKFIYIEDQYFVDTAPNTAGVDVRAALIDALPQIQHLTILIPHGSITPLQTPGTPSQTNYRRRLLIDALRNAKGGNKVRVYHLAPPGANHTYVHAKTWIFDDEYAIIGSANCNRRSWTHDSEAVIGVWDRGKADKSQYWFPHKLRMRLWAEHLGWDNFEDAKDGTDISKWLPGNRRFRARIANYEDAAGPFPAPEEIMDWNSRWDTFIDPDGS